MLTVERHATAARAMEVAIGKIPWTVKPRKKAVNPTPQK